MCKKARLNPTGEKQLLELQHTHTATLANLTLYHNALCEISDIAAQIQEAKLNPAITEVAEGEDARTELPTFDILLSGGGKSVR